MLILLYFTMNALYELWQVSLMWFTVVTYVYMFMNMCVYIEWMKISISLADVWWIYWKIKNHDEFTVILGKTTALIFYPEDANNRFVQKTGKFLLALKHILEDCILQVNVVVYWFMNIAGTVDQSLDLNRVWLAYDAILKDCPKTRFCVTHRLKILHSAYGA
jgi:hypothetical protein